MSTCLFHSLLLDLFSGFAVHAHLPGDKSRSARTAAVDVQERCLAAAHLRDLRVWRQRLE